MNYIESITNVENLLKTDECMRTDVAAINSDLENSIQELIELRSGPFEISNLNSFFLCDLFVEDCMEIITPIRRRISAELHDIDFMQLLDNPSGGYTIAIRRPDKVGSRDWLKIVNIIINEARALQQMATKTTQQ